MVDTPKKPITNPMIDMDGFKQLLEFIANAESGAKFSTNVDTYTLKRIDGNIIITGKDIEKYIWNNIGLNNLDNLRLLARRHLGDIFDAYNDKEKPGFITVIKDLAADADLDASKYPQFPQEANKFTLPEVYVEAFAALSMQELQARKLEEKKQEEAAKAGFKGSNSKLDEGKKFDEGESFSSYMKLLKPVETQLVALGQSIAQAIGGGAGKKITDVINLADSTFKLVDAMAAFSEALKARQEKGQAEGAAPAATATTATAATAPATTATATPTDTATDTATPTATATPAATATTATAATAPATTATATPTDTATPNPTATAPTATDTATDTTATDTATATPTDTATPNPTPTAEAVVTADATQVLQAQGEAVLAAHKEFISTYFDQTQNLLSRIGEIRVELLAENIADDVKKLQQLREELTGMETQIIALNATMNRAAGEFRIKIAIANGILEANGLSTRYSYEMAEDAAKHLAATHQQIKEALQECVKAVDAPVVETEAVVAVQEANETGNHDIEEIMDANIAEEDPSIVEEAPKTDVIALTAGDGGEGGVSMPPLLDTGSSGLLLQAGKTLLKDALDAIEQAVSDEKLKDEVKSIKIYEVQRGENPSKDRLIKLIGDLEQSEPSKEVIEQIKIIKDLYSDFQWQEQERASAIGQDTGASNVVSDFADAPSDGPSQTGGAPNEEASDIDQPPLPDSGSTQSPAETFSIGENSVKEGADVAKDNPIQITDDRVVVAPLPSGGNLQKQFEALAAAVVTLNQSNGNGKTVQPTEIKSFVTAYGRVGSNYEINLHHLGGNAELIGKQLLDAINALDPKELRASVQITTDPDKAGGRVRIVCKGFEGVKDFLDADKNTPFEYQQRQSPREVAGTFITQAWDIIMSAQARLNGLTSNPDKKEYAEGKAAQNTVREERLSEANAGFDKFSYKIDGEGLQNAGRIGRALDNMAAHADYLRGLHYSVSAAGDYVSIEVKQAPSVTKLQGLAGKLFADLKDSEQQAILPKEVVTALTGVETGAIGVMDRSGAIHIQMPKDDMKAMSDHWIKQSVNDRDAVNLDAVEAKNTGSVIRFERGDGDQVITVREARALRAMIQEVNQPDEGGKRPLDGIRVVFTKDSDGKIHLNLEARSHEAEQKIVRNGEAPAQGTEDKRPVNIVLTLKELLGKERAEALGAMPAGENQQNQNEDFVVDASKLGKKPGILGKFFGGANNLEVQTGTDFLLPESCKLENGRALAVGTGASI